MIYMMEKVSKCELEVNLDMDEGQDAGRQMRITLVFQSYIPLNSKEIIAHTALRLFRTQRRQDRN